MISGHLIRASHCQRRDSDIGGSSDNCLRQIASFDVFVGTSLVKFLGYTFIFLYNAHENYRYTYICRSGEPQFSPVTDLGGRKQCHRPARCSWMLVLQLRAVREPGPFWGSSRRGARLALRLPQEGAFPSFPKIKVSLASGGAEGRAFDRQHAAKESCFRQRGKIAAGACGRVEGEV